MSRFLLSAPRSILWSSVLIAVGLALELVSLFFANPVSFTTFLVASACMAAGVLVFVLAVLRRPTPTGADS